MDEKQTEEKVKPEDAAPDTDGGGKSETESLIEQSNKAAERNEKVLAELKKENDRAEKMLIQRQLAGKGEAIKTQVPVISKEEAAAQERINAIGLATGAKWAQPKEETTK